MTKDRTVGVRLGAEDLARLERLTEHYALSTSSVIRMLLKQATDALAPVAPEVKKPKR